MKQNLMLVARDNRKIMKKDLRKKQLKNLKAFGDEKKNLSVTCVCCQIFSCKRKIKQK